MSKAEVKREQRKWAAFYVFVLLLIGCITSLLALRHL